jgi:hypothetical protein
MKVTHLPVSFSGTGNYCHREISEIFILYRVQDATISVGGHIYSKKTFNDKDVLSVLNVPLLVREFYIDDNLTERDEFLKSLDSALHEVMWDGDY